MDTIGFRSLVVAFLFAIVTGSVAFSAPIAFDELSLLVRMREADTSISIQVSERRLLRALTPDQETSLKKLGVSDGLLQTLKDPKLVVAETEAAAFEKRRSEQRKLATEIPVEQSQVAPSDDPLPVIQPAEVVTEPKLEPVATGVNLIIERVRIILHPIPPPYYVYLRAEAGRSVAVFENRKQSFGGIGGIDSMELDIPMNVVMKDVRLNSWAAITLQLDADADAAPSYRALKRHTARLQMLEGSHQERFVPQQNPTPFVYEVHYRTSR